jgi:molybdopterin converting factor small subunit
MTLAASCSYDDTALKNQVEKIEHDLAALTERVAALEQKLADEVESLEALIDGKVVVVDVVTDAEGNQTIKLSDGSEVTVLAPEDSLQYHVVDGVLEVSADGENWIPVQVAPEQVVANIVINEDGTATITLANGDEFTVVKAELIECEAARTGVFVPAGGVRDVAFAVNDAVVDINVMNQPFGWSATVEEATAPEAGDQGGVDPMPLAAGGKNYVLKIYGPDATFAQAAKEGVVSVHFNTAAGACKVLKVNVELAQLTIAVDNSGNITLTNSVAQAAGYDELGNPMYDFVDFHIGIVAAEDYATYGDRVFAETFDDYTYEYTANVASTMRTTGFQNVVDLQWYEDGVCEEEVYTLTVDQLAGAFWPKYTFELGKEYIIFATTESEMVSYVEQPILTNAAKASYKCVNVEAKLLEETITWNDATCEFNLAGYNYYVVGWTPVSDLQDIINNGMATDLDSALSAMISAYGVMSAGAIVADMNATVKLSELAAVSLTQWAPMLNSDTEYVFFVYPFNAATEMELYTHTFIPENLFNYGTFRTKALVQGSFDAAAEFELVSLDEKNVAVNATFSEDVVTVAYNWSETSYMDPEEAAAFILGDLYYTEYVTFDEYVTYLEASNYKYYGIPDPYYLCVLAINAAGEYAYVEYDVRSEQGEEPAEPEVEVIEMSPIASAKFAKNTYLYLYSEDGKYCAVYYLYGIVDSNKGYLPAGEYTIGADYPGIYGYGYSYLYDYVTYSATHDFDAGGVMKVSEVDGAYHIEFNGTLNDGLATMEFVYDGAIEGLILPSEYVEATALEFTPVRADYDLKLAGENDSEYAYWLYDANNNYIEVICHYNSNTGWNYVFEGKLVANGETYELTKITTQQPSDYNCAEGEKYFAIGEAKFSNNTVYSYTGQLTAVEVNYEGEGANYVPGSENQGGDEPSEPEVVPEFVIPGDGTYDLDLRFTKLQNALNANNEVRFVDENDYTFDVMFNPGLTEIVAGNYTAVHPENYSSADALEFSGYMSCIQVAYGDYIYPDDYANVTCNVQKEGDYYCITIITGTGSYGADGRTCRAVYIGKIK